MGKESPWNRQYSRSGGYTLFPLQNRRRPQDSPLAAYCRVSTDSEEQLTSYTAQKAYYTQKIGENPDWEMAGIFADKGITGTSMKKRVEFKKMITACKRGKIDLILTKSLSRFARNTVDSLEVVRMLRANGIGVIFEKENINTLTESSEFLLTLFSGFAQAESESISKNVIWGIQKSREAGNVPFQYQKMLGYRRGPDSQPEIVPAEAEVVKRIYRRYLDGCSLAQIKRELEADGVPVASGIRGWTYQVVRNILTNASAKIGLRQKPLQQEGTGLVLFHFSARRLQMKKTTKIIAVCNQKGGVGKTVTTVNLGVGLARQGKRVLLVDVDPQGSLTASLGYHQPDRIEKTLSTVLGRIVQQQPFEPAEYILHQDEGVDLLPANIDLAMVEMNLVGVMGRETVLRELLEAVRGQYDYILLDCCPSLGTLTANALTAADEVIIPMLAHYLSIKGLEQLLATIGLVRRKFNPGLQISGILITMANMRTAYSRDIVALLRESYGDKLRIFDTIIPESIRAAETSAEGKSIYLHDPTGKVSAAYSAFTLEAAS